jgi:hypothetical protein
MGQVTRTLTSSNFSFGFGFTDDPFGWTTAETDSTNTPTTQGDFSFEHTVTGSNNSSGGCTFVNRVLTDQLPGENGRSANGEGFLATFVGTYNGPTPADALPEPNFRLTLNITNISMYVCAYDNTANPMAFAETTPDHAAASPGVNDPVPPNNATVVSNYSHLVWDPADFSVTGTTSTRLFTITAPTLVNVQMDGFEVLGNVQLTYDAVAPAASTWNVDADGNWSVAGNWLGGVPSGEGAVANFATVITAPRTVTVDSPQTVGAMNFASPISYTIGGTSTLTLDSSAGPAAINVTDGSHTISAPIAMNDNLVVNSTPGSLSVRHLRRAASATAGLTLSAGTLRVLANGTPNDPAGTSVVSSLAITPGAVLDLTNNSAVIDYTGAVGTQVDDVRQHLQSGRLTSSSADAARRLGYGDNAVLGRTSFAGQTVDGSSILIKYTYAGDANLDGQVDITDLGNLATAWQTAGPWTSGDFDYSNFVDITDLGMLATNWQAGVGSPLRPGDLTLSEALASFGLPSVAVPEPTWLCTVSLAGLLAIRRRRA